MKQNPVLSTLDTFKELFACLTHPRDYSFTELSTVVNFISKNFPIRNQALTKEIMKLQKELYIRKLKLSNFLRI